MVKRTQEIERKWLVSKLPRLGTLKREHIVQGYLVISSDGGEVRIRRKGKTYYETVKSQGTLMRDEIEVKISSNQFHRLWPATRGRRLKKVRFTWNWNGHHIEIDVYQGSLATLIIAEVEFASIHASRQFSPPAWFGKEVTEVQRYKNNCLARSVPH
ncbi:MAG: CYTH domain-containing protein [Nitrospirales bacterium]